MTAATVTYYTIAIVIAEYPVMHKTTLTEKKRIFCLKILIKSKLKILSIDRIDLGIIWILTTSKYKT